METPQKSDPKEVNVKSYEVDIQRIDFYAFIISSCSFLIFNIGYWFTFLVINLIDCISNIESILVRLIQIFYKIHITEYGKLIHHLL